MPPVLKTKSSIKGRDKLPLVSAILSDPNPAVDELARFKKDEPLALLSAQELLIRLEELLGENPRTLLAVVKVNDDDADGIRGVAHQAIVHANEAGLARQVPQKRLAEPPQEDVEPPLTKRIKELERQVNVNDELRQSAQVEDTLRQVRAMAKRVTFQGPTHLVEALSYLVETATKFSHKGRDLFASALAAVKQDEDDPEVGQLVLSILGSDADKKVAEAKQKWLKSKVEPVENFNPELVLQNRRNRMDRAWVTWEGRPAMAPPELSFDAIEQVASGSVQPDFGLLSFPDESAFVAGTIHDYLPSWEKILADNPQRDTILLWVRDGVSVPALFRPFKGSFKGKNYDSVIPPSVNFRNASICEQYTAFISATIKDRLLSGAVDLWGKVGCCAPPHLVMPLTIEESKPRLCHDERYLNLWIKDLPFTLDSLSDVPRMVSRETFLTTCDEKNGYQHVRVTEESKTYLGFEFAGFYYVYSVLPFGFKASAYVYQSIGMAPTQFARSLGVGVLQYIDDRLISEVNGLKVKFPVDLSVSVSFLRSLAATYVVCATLLSLGYYINLAKSVLTPTKEVRYLGMICSATHQAFIIPQDKRESFGRIQEKMMAADQVPIKMLQKFTGKCVSLSNAIPMARLYTREMNAGLSKALKYSSLVRLTGPIKEEIGFWSFVSDSAMCPMPWLDERHVIFGMSTDASGFAWGVTFQDKSGNLRTARDLFSPEEMRFNITIKEALALLKALQAFQADLRSVRVVVKVDNLNVIHSWQNQGSRSVEMSRVIKDIVGLLINLNSSLVLEYVPSAANQADAPSRVLDKMEATLSPELWSMVQAQFGGLSGHTVDLMASDSNVMRDRNGRSLKHFSRYPSPNTAGVDLFAQNLEAENNMYVFPPISLIPAVLRFLAQAGVPCTVVVPKLSPIPFWWPGLVNGTSKFALLAEKGSMGALLYPSKNGYQADKKGLPWDLYAIRVTF